MGPDILRRLVVACPLRLRLDHLALLLKLVPLLPQLLDHGEGGEHARVQQPHREEKVLRDGACKWQGTSRQVRSDRLYRAGMLKLTR